MKQKFKVRSMFPGGRKELIYILARQKELEAQLGRTVHIQHQWNGGQAVLLYAIFLFYVSFMYLLCIVYMSSMLFCLSFVFTRIMSRRSIDQTRNESQLKYRGR